MEQTADIALIGLAVMGQNLIMNMNDHGYTVVAFNRTTSKVDEFLNDAAKGRTTILGAHSIEEMVKLLKRPRKIMLMVKAGKPVDEFIETLLPHLELLETQRILASSAKIAMLPGGPHGRMLANLMAAEKQGEGE